MSRNTDFYLDAAIKIIIVARYRDEEIAKFNVGKLLIDMYQAGWKDAHKECSDAMKDAFDKSMLHGKI